MKKRIYVQMTAIAAMASLATMLLVAFVCYELFCGQILEDLRTDAYLLKEAENREDILQSDLVASGGLLRVTWVDGQGEVIFENSADAAEMNNHSGRPEILPGFGRRRRGGGTKIPYGAEKFFLLCSQARRRECDPRSEGSGQHMEHFCGNSSGGIPDPGDFARSLYGDRPLFDKKLAGADRKDCAECGASLGGGI